MTKTIPKLSASLWESHVTKLAETLATRQGLKHKANLMSKFVGKASHNFLKQIVPTTEYDFSARQTLHLTEANVHLHVSFPL